MRSAIETKLKRIKELVKEINNVKAVALISLEGMPSKQLQKLRHELKDRMRLVITAKNNIIHALEEVNKPGLNSLVDKITGSCCLGLTNDDPFKLSLFIQMKKTPAPAKAGQKAPSDIVVRAGPTSFAPGPVITDLANLGLKTKVDAGKLTIIADAVIVKVGDVINAAQASMMARLGLTPMSTGLSLLSVWDNGHVYDAKELIIDVDYYRDQVGEAYIKALKLAFSTEVPIPQVMNSLIQFAHAQAMNLSINTGIPTKDNAGFLLLKASAEAKALADKINWR